jgi:hypothetical protein
VTVRIGVRVTGKVKVRVMENQRVITSSSAQTIWAGILQCNATAWGLMEKAEKLIVKKEDMRIGKGEGGRELGGGGGLGLGLGLGLG